MKKLLIVLVLLGSMVAEARPCRSRHCRNDDAFSSFLVAFASFMTLEDISYHHEHPRYRKIIIAAKDSAAAYMIDGEVDALLARATEVMDEIGFQDATLEEKAALIVEGVK